MDETPMPGSLQFDRTGHVRPASPDPQKSPYHLWLKESYPVGQEPPTKPSEEEGGVFRKHCPHCRNRNAVAGLHLTGKLAGPTDYSVYCGWCGGKYNASREVLT